MEFKMKIAGQDYWEEFLFGLTTTQLAMVSISRAFKARGFSPLTALEMGIIYQVEPQDLNRYEEFVKTSKLSRKRLIDAITVSSPLVARPPYDHLKFAVDLAEMSEHEARQAIFNRGLGSKIGYSFGNVD
jgi:hypothetical protein